MASDQALNFINVLKYMPIKKKRLHCICHFFIQNTHQLVLITTVSSHSSRRNALQISIHILAYFLFKKKKKKKTFGWKVYWIYFLNGLLIKKEKKVTALSHNFLLDLLQTVYQRHKSKFSHFFSIFQEDTKNVEIL